MTVMSAQRAGGIQIIQTATVAEIVDRLADPVFKLLRAGMVDAALVLLDAEVEDFMAAWRLEYVGITPQPRIIMEPRAGCTSLNHPGLDCASALSQGLLAEGVPFCQHCTQKQAALPFAPETITDTGTIIRIVTPAGATNVHTPAAHRVS